MVDVIESALIPHNAKVVYYNADEGHVECHGCDWQGPSFTGFAAHQARAVLAAISEAGAVEVVTGYGVKLRSGDVERCGTIIADARECMAEMVGWHDDYYNPVEVVTRTTTIITHRTNWTAVEG